MSQMLGNGLNSKLWGVNYAIGPKKYANRLVPWSVEWVAGVALRPRQERMILMAAPCKLR